MDNQEIDILLKNQSLKFEHDPRCALRLDLLDGIGEPERDTPPPGMVDFILREAHRPVPTDNPSPECDGAQMSWVGHNFPCSPMPIEALHSRTLCCGTAAVCMQDKELVYDEVSLNPRRES